MSKDKSIKKSSYRQLFEFSLVASAIVVFVFLVMYTVQLNNGIAKEIKAPQYNLRIEILNAGAENGLEEKLTAYLNELEIENITLDIILASRFSLQPSKETFIINRSNEKSGVNALAEILQIEKEKIQYSELSNNKNHLSATIVIGTDSLIYRLLEKTKELE